MCQRKLCEWTIPEINCHDKRKNAIANLLVLFSERAFKIPIQETIGIRIEKMNLE